MRVVRSFEELNAVVPGALSATVGNFDGFHLGHAAVAAELLSAARRRGTPAVLVTFEPHPLTVVGAPGAAFVLTPSEAGLVAEAELDAMVVHPFDASVAAMSGRDFLSALSRGRLAHLVLGYDFRMGSGRACDVAGLTAITGEMGCTLEVVAAVRRDGVPISSSRVRDALWTKRPEEAAAMLGRPYRLKGRVARGEGVGSALGFPTANLEPPCEKLVPHDGVYRARVRDERRAGALLYVGRRPTLGTGERRIEVHVPGWDGLPYGGELEVEVLAFVREDRAFRSAEELANQIARDVAENLKAPAGSAGTS